jgi:membrane associated rhomboid family serine protease
VAVILPESVWSILALGIAIAAVPYAYLSRYKASLVFGVAFVSIFALQIVGSFDEPVGETIRSGGQDFQVAWDPIEYELALQPAVFLRGDEWWTPLTHMFVHSDFFHIFGNGLSLLFFGPKLEQHIGTRRFATLYLVAGLFAVVVSVLLFPGSETRMLGASGAISGVLGLYVLRFPRDQIWMPIGFLPVALPAWGFLIVFVLLQFWMAFTIVGVAWWAHLAGLAVGLVAGFGMWMKGRARSRPDRYEPEAGAGWTVEYYGR